MGYTITEKILLAHTDKKDIKPGEFIYAEVDIALGNDITAPLAIKEFKALGLKSVFDKDKLVLVSDHFAPDKDSAAANQCRILHEFAKEHDIKNYFRAGDMGIEHSLLPEHGIVGPGMVVIGADSHTCTYGALGAFATGVGSTDLAAVMATGKCWFKVPESMKFAFFGKLKKWVGGKDLILYTIGRIGVDGALYRAMEFTGPVIESLCMDDRMAMCNMAVEAGAKSGIIAADRITRDYMKQTRPGRPKDYNEFRSDKDANYSNVHQFDAGSIEPQVSCPHLPSNARPVGELKDIRIDQAVIGSCTNGRLSDLRVAADILKGKKAAPCVRLIVIPATQKIYKQAIEEGLTEIFVKAGGVFTTPTCGPCIGGHMGVLADGEVAIAATNRNFRGRMGSLESEVYLSGPAVAAASAVAGRIVHPDAV